MTTIGYATLQIIPSLKGVTEAIEKQVEGKVVAVAIEPKVDQRAADKAGQQAKQTVEKHTTKVVVEPKVDQKAAEKAGRDIGKTVNDEITSSAKSSAGKEAAKAIVDGIADGVKQEMPRGGVGEAIVDGIADGVKQGIDGVGIGGEVVTTISTGIKSGNLGGTIRDAVIPAIRDIGQEIRSGASTWASGIGDALRSGDIQGATSEIATTVQSTTDLIADIGTTFGLQLDGVREFGDTAATTLSQVGGSIQGAIDTANVFSSTLSGVGTLLEAVLPEKASKGVAAMTATIAPLITSVAGLNAAVAMLPKDAQGIAASAIPGVLPAFKDQGADKPWYERDITADAWRWLQKRLKGNSAGGFTGNVPTDKVAGLVHGAEYVIKASSTASIENAMPGLLDYLNNNGALPGFKGGGKVSLGNISAPGITTAEQQSMWDAVRSNFPNAILSSATRTVMTEGHPDYHNAGRAIDISGPGMGAIASWIASNYPDSLELIHSPFSSNIKNGKNVGDGTGFYGAGLMAAHRDHVHWALGRAATVKSQPSEPSATRAAPASPLPSMRSASAPTASAGEPMTMSEPAATSASSSFSMDVPGSFSGLAGMGGEQLGKLSPVTSPDGKSQSLDQIGSAVGEVAAGQVSSALNMFGINDSPGWLKGLSMFASGLNFGGDGAGAAPLAAASSLVPAATSAAAGIVHGGSGAAPGPQVNYNIKTATVEDAFLVAQRREKERAAATLARY